MQLPTGFQFNVDEVCVSRFGDTVVLYPKEVAWDKMIQSLSEFTPDFIETRNQGVPAGPGTSDETERP